jgi:hypothetical protein
MSKCNDLLFVELSRFSCYSDPTALFGVTTAKAYFSRMAMKLWLDVLNLVSLETFIESLDGEIVKKVVLFLIIALGLSLRVIGADWGFPFLVHPDESVVADIPAQMAERSSLDPSEYNHPDHFGIYANVLLQHAASHIVYHKPLTDTFENHKLLFYHLSRIFVAILGTACIVAAFLVGREYTWNTGLVAALLVALFPSYVNHSHFITADIPLTLFVLLAILFTTRYLKDPTDKNLLAAACFSALAVSVKYPGVLTLLLVLSAIVGTYYKEKRIVYISVIKVLAAFLVCLFISSPYLFFNWSKVLQSLFLNAAPVHLGADGLGWFGNMLFYVKTYLDFSGSLLALFFLIGVYYLIKKEKMHALPMFFGLFYWIVLSKIGLHWERWALPMYTCPLLVSAYGITSAFDKSLLISRRLLFPMWCMAVLFIFCGLLLNSTVATANFTLKDTRVAAFRFAQEKGINENDTLYEGYTPFYPQNLRYGSVRDVYYSQDNNKKIQYVILSSGVYERYLEESGRYKAEREFYNKIFALPLIGKFAAKEYFPDSSNSFFLSNDLAREAAFLIDYSRNKKELLNGPTILIYKYSSPGFLDHEHAL